jgi:hypothetical protein
MLSSDVCGGSPRGDRRYNDRRPLYSYCDCFLVAPEACDFAWATTRDRSRVANTGGRSGEYYSVEGYEL